MLSYPGSAKPPAQPKTSLPPARSPMACMTEAAGCASCAAAWGLAKRPLLCGGGCVVVQMGAPWSSETVRIMLARDVQPKGAA